MRPAAALLGALLSLPAAPLAAHPHVWIVAQAGFRLETGRVVAIEVAFHLDELLSASLIADFDRDRDGRFDATETARLEREVLAGLAELDWLAHLRIAGRPARLEPPGDFRAERGGESVTLRFARRLATPADPRAATVALTLADPSWYVDVVLDPDAPAILEGEVPAGCGLAFEVDTTLTGHVAPVPPVAALLTCARSS